MNAGELKAFVFWHGDFSWEADSHVKDLTAGELRALPTEKSNGLTQPCAALPVQSRRGSAVMTMKGILREYQRMLPTAVGLFGSQRVTFSQEPKSL